MRPLVFTLMTSLLSAQLPQDPARIQVFEATLSTVRAGEAVELHWSATGTDRIRLEPLDQDFPPVGSATYKVKERTVFWIHASNMRGGQSVPLVVEIMPEESPSLRAQSGNNEGSRTPPPLDRIWIQFAALADTGNTERLNKELSQFTGSKVARFDTNDPGHPGQRLHRLRMGPFSSIREARKRLRSLQSRLRSLHIQPIVVVD